MITRHSLVEVDQVPSTQDEARRRYHGVPVLVWAKKQTRGRGRSGSGWVEAPRAMATSLAFEPSWSTGEWGPLPLVAGLAACEAIGRGICLKWPNDLVVEDRKVGGILVEATGTVVVAGLGLNLWWPEPPEGIGALYADDPGEEQSRTLAGRWADSLLSRLVRPAGDWGREEYRGVSATIGSDIAWDPEGNGRAVDVAADGGLVVDVDGVQTILRSGEVHNVRTGRID